MTTTAIEFLFRTGIGGFEAFVTTLDGDGDADVEAAVDGLDPLVSSDEDAEADGDALGLGLELELWPPPQPTMMIDSATATVALDRRAGDIGAPFTSSGLGARETLAGGSCYTVPCRGDA